ncbi:unnamed protein product [Schistosoma turkestanicum]|nr:unnamed protein product [Schistosoma turkestanicum]
MYKMDDDFYNDSVGDQVLLELNITNLTSNLTDIHQQTTTVTEKEITDKLHSSMTIPNQFIDFPYPKPYSQQLELMQTVYKTLESNCCGIFESPTGTGKSLSLLTATLRWLLDYNEKQIMLLNNLQSQLKLMNHENKENNTKGYDWIMEYDKNRLLKQQIEPQIEDLLIYQSSLQLIEKIKLSSSTSSSSLLTKHHIDSSNVDEITITEANADTIDIEQLKNIIDVPDDHHDNDDDDIFLCQPNENLFNKHKINEFDETELNQQFENQQQESDNGLLRVIYCSRTHSQLGQIAKEFEKCKTLFDKVTIIQLSSRNLLCINENIYQLKHPDLINIACLELNRPRTHKEGQSKDFKCPMRNLTAVNNLSKHLLIGNSALNITSSIRGKQLSQSSKSIKTVSSTSKEYQKDETSLDNTQLSQIGCPYYANRKGIPLAQLILVPYSSLLQLSNRLASGLTLKNSIVIIDEAHNLLEATASSMSVSLSLMNDINKLEELFSDYLQYYRSRLSSFLILRLRQMKHFLQQLKLYLNTTLKNIQLSLSSTSFNVIIKTVNKLFSESNLDNINLSEFIDCLEYQHFIMKLIGFSKWSNIRKNFKHSDNVATNQTACSKMTNLLNTMKRKYSDANNKCGNTSQVCISNKKSKIDIEKSEGIGSSLFKFHSFLQALEFSEEDARIIIEPMKNSTKLNLSISPSDVSSSSNDCTDDTLDLCLRVIFLNPGRYLKDLVQEAKSVLLVGGTMQPFSEAIDQIFIPSGKLPNEIVTFTCDHVINAKKQLAVYPLGVHNHHSNEQAFSLDFTYQNRSNPHMIDVCGEIILQICQQLPAGIVVFTPSYEYQSILYNHWESTGLLDKITKYKSLFHEPKTTVNLDQIMQAYAVAATQKLQHKHGALLLCVIGGKLSEGINFTDDLARVVVIIGMPYANPQSPILREKMTYLDRHFIRNSHSAQTPGRQYYETMCMRSINQAIGRSIRHAKDYAVVFLLDNRYCRSTIQTQLPKWVQQSIIHQRLDDKQLILLSSSNQQTKFLNLSEALEHAKRFFSSNKECFG